MQTESSAGAAEESKARRQEAGAPDRSPDHPLIRQRDLTQVALLLALGFLSWSLAERRWDPLARGLARLHDLRYRNRGKRPRRIRSLIGSHGLAMTPEDCAKRQVANHLLERLQLLRAYRPGGWNPEIRLEGREHVEAALAGGRGAILWVSPLTFGDLVTKMALHREGYSLHHLSRWSHNLSHSRLGARFINPVCTIIERRFLAERMVIAEDNLIAGRNPSDLIRERLRDNRLVSVTAVALGRRQISVPFLDQEIRLASGPPWIASTERAPLLPVFTIRHGDGSFVTRIEAALNPPPEKTADLVELVRAYVRCLEHYVLNYPDQIRWHHVSIPD